MDIRELIRELIHGFFYIYTGSIFGTYIFCSIFDPSIKFGLEYFMFMVLFALAGDLTILIFYSGKVLSEKEFMMRTIIHFIVLEIVLLTFAGILNLYENFGQAVVFSLIILLVYSIVKLLLFTGNKREAEEINKRIREMNENREDS